MEPFRSMPAGPNHAPFPRQRSARNRSAGSGGRERARTDRIRRRGAFLRPHAHSRGGWIMFENQQRDDVEALMKADAEFRRLYQHHRELDSKVHDAEIGVLPLDDVTLSCMKKEKLHAKTRLERMWEGRRQLSS